MFIAIHILNATSFVGFFCFMFMNIFYLRWTLGVFIWGSTRLSCACLSWYSRILICRSRLFWRITCFARRFFAITTGGPTTQAAQYVKAIRSKAERFQEFSTDVTWPRTTMMTTQGEQQTPNTTLVKFKSFCRSIVGTKIKLLIDICCTQTTIIDKNRQGRLFLTFDYQSIINSCIHPPFPYYIYINIYTHTGST